MASAFALRLRARWLSSGPADSQPVASDTRNHMMLLTCERMLLCECMCVLLASSHACSVRVECAVHACARVQGAGQRAWVRHARRSPVRDMPLVKVRILPAGEKGKILITILRVKIRRPARGRRPRCPSLCRTQQSGVSRCLPAVHLPHHRAVYRHGQKRTHSCAYISATTSPASGCKAISRDC